MRVLIIEDNEDTAMSMARLLRFAGQNVRIGMNGEEALTLAADFRPEVVLLDLWLPNMDGYEVAKRLRQVLDSSPVRIIALSGAKVDLTHDGSPSIDLYLAKPASINEILGAIGADLLRFPLGAKAPARK